MTPPSFTLSSSPVDIPQPKQPTAIRGYRPANWKFTGLRDRLRQTWQPWIWVDDEQVGIAEQIEPHWLEELHAIAPGLTVNVDQREMITWEQLAQIEEFLRINADAGVFSRR